MDDAVRGVPARGSLAVSRRSTTDGVSPRPAKRSASRSTREAGGRGWLEREFARWLKVHAGRFPVRLVPTREEEGIPTAYRFRGVPYLELHVHHGNFEVWVLYRGKSMDIIMELDIWLRRSRHGNYHCASCIVPKDYPTKTLIAAEHSFEPFLAWCTEKFRDDQFLSIYEASKGFSWANIRPMDKVEADAPGVAPNIFVKPVLRRRPSKAR